MKKLLLLILLLSSIIGYSQDFIFWGSQVTSSLYSLNSTNGQVNTLQTGQLMIRRLRVDQDLEQLFWSSGNLNNIQKSDANLQGTGLSLVKNNLNNIATIATDAVNNKIYYHLGNGNEISTCDTIGGNVSTLINLSGNKLVLGIEIDKNANQIYWTEINSGSLNLIKRADLPLGTNITTIYSTSDFIFDIKLFPKDSSIYFTNRTGNKVEKVDLDGNNLQTLITEPASTIIGAISGDYCNDAIYYILNNSGTGSEIRKTDLQGTPPTIVLDTTFSQLAGIDVLYEFNIGDEGDFLGQDLIICEDSTILDATVRGGSYLWNDNSTNSKLTVKQSGSYTVTVSSGNCTKIDSIQVNLNSNFNVNLGNDTTINFGDSIILDATTVNASYLWSNNSTSSSITVKQTGIYWVDVTVGSCTKRDSIRINLSQAQIDTISGIINDYSEVTAIRNGICFDTISVLNPSLFTVGDKVLVIQMQGATANTTNTTSFGNVTNLNEAGLFEFVIINDIINSKVALTGVLKNTYSISGNVQLITVPVYQNALISNTLTASNWDGSKGGVLAFEVIDSLTLLSDINVNEKGFTGGTSFFGSYSFASGNCAITDLFNASGNFNGGQKGEGVSIISPNQSFGRGHFSNGGGGGNSHNSGGAGGANAGAGGLGGNEWSGCTSAAVGGISGEPIQYSLSTTRAIMGGGAGGGDANGTGGTDGGNGGGLAFIKANTLIGNNRNISTNGESALSAGPDGAGGGGAGGSILIDVQTYSTLVNLSVIGGNGGNNNNAGSCVGTGGGGGGGVIWNSGIVLPPNVITSFNGGSAGILTNPAVPCPNNNYGSSAGANGLNFANTIGTFDIINSTSISTSFFENDTTLCFGDSILLDATTVNASYLWSNNSTSSSVTIEQSGIYWVDVTVNNCTVRDSITVNYNPVFNFSLGNDTTLCFGDSILLDPTVPTATYTWSNNSADSTIIVKSSGIYFVDVNINGCVKRDSINITFENSNIDFFLDNDTTLCDGDSMVFDLSLPGYTFLWSDSSTLSQFTITSPGTYWAEVAGNNCPIRDSIKVNYSPTPRFNLPNDTTLCKGELFGTSNSNPNTNYLWNTGSNDSVIVIPRSGTYWLETFLDGCIFRDSIDIITKPIPQINLGIDTTLCIGDSLTLFQSSFSAQYLWSDSSTLSSIKIEEAGTYWLNFTIDGCETRDSILIEYFDTLGASFLPTTADFCEGDLLQFDIPLVNSTYLWQDGSTDNPYSILNLGLHTVQISNTCGTRTDSVLVIEKCKCEVVTPNSFTPNNDFVNDLFLPQINCEVTNYSLTIYARWGEKVFESNRSSYSWDGRKDGRNMKAGVYYYILKWAEIDSNIQTKKGNVLLLR